MTILQNSKKLPKCKQYSSNDNDMAGRVLRDATGRIYILKLDMKGKLIVAPVR